MGIKAILFDKDGTLIDFSATFNPATDHILRQLCADDPGQLEALANAWGFDLKSRTIRDDSVIIAGSGSDLVELALPYLDVQNKFEFREELDRMFGEICADTVAALPGIEEALKLLADKGVFLGIGTNDAEQNAISQMRALEFEHFFGQIFGADSGHGAKPGPGMVKAFADTCNLDPGEIMMVGDSLHDLEAGRAAGAFTCGVETGPADRAVLEKHADIVLSSVADLPVWLDGMQ